MIFKTFKEVDWYDVDGMIIVYAIGVVLAFTIIYRNDRNIISLGLAGIMFLIIGLIFFWQKLKWGTKASLLLIALVLAIIFTPFYTFYKVYLAQSRDRKGG